VEISRSIGIGWAIKFFLMNILNKLPTFINSNTLTGSPYPMKNDKSSSIYCCSYVLKNRYYLSFIFRIIIFTLVYRVTKTNYFKN